MKSRRVVLFGKSYSLYLLTVFTRTSFIELELLYTTVYWPTTQLQICISAQASFLIDIFDTFPFDVRILFFDGIAHHYIILSIVLSNVQSIVISA